ncbi:MAG: helix-turn-helix transcriptional regulator [Planctomycetota bacterium]
MDAQDPLSESLGRRASREDASQTLRLPAIAGNSNAMKTAQGTRNADKPGSEEERLAVWNGLTDRQREVLDRLLAGDSEKEIAGRLGISRHTVHGHVKDLHRLHAVCSRGELLARYVQSPASPDADEAPTVRSRPKVEHLHVEVVKAERLEVSTFSGAMSIATSIRPAAAAGGAAAMLVVGGLLFLTGTGRAAEDRTRDNRWEAAKERAAVDFDEHGFPIQFSPTVQTPFQQDEWTPVSRVVVGRTYRLTGHGTFHTLNGASLVRHHRVGFIQPSVGDVLHIRRGDDEIRHVTLEDLGPTASLDADILDQMKLHGPLAPPQPGDAAPQPSDAAP